MQNKGYFLNDLLLTQTWTWGSPYSLAGGSKIASKRSGGYIHHTAKLHKYIEAELKNYLTIFIIFWDNSNTGRTNQHLLKAGLYFPNLVMVKNEPILFIKKEIFAHPHWNSEPKLVLLLTQDDSCQWCLWTGNILCEIFCSYLKTFLLTYKILKTLKGEKKMINCVWQQRHKGGK